VVDGKVAVLHPGQARGEDRPWGVFGEMALVDRAPAPRDRRLGDNCGLLAIGRNTFLD